MKDRWQRVPVGRREGDEKDLVNLLLEKVRKDQRSQITFEDINSLVSETSTYEFLRPAKGYLNSSYVL